MPNGNGKLIVIEGLDGSGKATQSALLAERLQKRGEEVVKITFPDYESRSSELVKLYLSGELGAARDVNAYAASMFYAADRYISYSAWKKQYLAGHTIVADRYATSNAVHQMPKLPEAEWDSYLEWLYDTEFDRMGLPRPDLVLYLDMPLVTNRRLLRERYGGDGQSRDIHEKDSAYLDSCRPAALYAAKTLGWKIVNCAEEGAPIPVGVIADQIDGLVEQLF